MKDKKSKEFVSNMQHIIEDKFNVQKHELATKQDISRLKQDVSLLKQNIFLLENKLVAKNL